MNYQELDDQLHLFLDDWNAGAIPSREMYSRVKELLRSDSYQQMLKDGQQYTKVRNEVIERVGVFSCRNNIEHDMSSLGNNCLYCELAEANLKVSHLQINNAKQEGEHIGLIERIRALEAQIEKQKKAFKDVMDAMREEYNKREELKYSEKIAALKAELKIHQDRLCEKHMIDDSEGCYECKLTEARREIERLKGELQEGLCSQCGQPDWRQS